MHARFRLPLDSFTLDVDLELPARGVTALFGPSGSGKTSLLRCIAGLAQAPEGKLTLGDDCWQDSARKRFVPTHKRALGYVFQEASLFAHLSVQDNLRFGLKRIAAAGRRLQQQQAVALLGLEDLLQRMPQHLSGGERQRVGIARALLTSPRILLLDEPLSALDAPRKADILPYLERLHGELDIPILYVSHALDEVIRLADHLVLLDSGRALASGPLQAMLPRLDLPLAQGDDASVVIDGTAAEYDRDYQLLSLRLPHSDLRLRVAHQPIAYGQPLRLRVQARDVSLSLQQPQHSSILNLLPVRVMAVAAADNPAHLLVQLDMQGSALLARITRYSSDQLGLQPGQALWAQIKAVALLG
ncbi:molybdate transport system ATP-binding protein [Halopseudomonas sabulinigri]|uniref:Molybdate transport system ATP-binding protein n=1 Tax=Halopseudomonas sabulinigri TaxID=472181 RepID=A0A1H1U8M7_9GAMM|nr:molybdenum ABC transporter ATP-binding protein [Halopseudomonas sabulinigri]SDS68838.1 molybdate transport system ATP-binding protein [Halopseudomonas sabulinigri]